MNRDLPRAEWALANVLQTWKREAGPLVRKAYKQACDGTLDRELADAAARWVEGMGRTLRAAADEAVTTSDGAQAVAPKEEDDGGASGREGEAA